jgi:hypothetical protein
MSEDAGDTSTHRMMLELTSRKALECRLHHVLATANIRGVPKLLTFYHLCGTSYEADATNLQPYMRGVIVTPTMRVVPNFARTPRVMVSPALAAIIAADDPGPQLLFRPALDARLLRAFYYDGGWRYATSRRLCPARAPLFMRFSQCVIRKTGASLQQLENALDRSRVWFFAVPRGASCHICTLGSTELLTLDHTGQRPAAARGGSAAASKALVWRLFGTTTLREEADGIGGIPGVPPLASAYDGGMPVQDWLEAQLDPGTLRYHDGYNGIVVVNRETLSAVRVVAPSVFLLGPLVETRDTDVRMTVLRILFLHYVLGWHTLGVPVQQIPVARATHGALEMLAHHFPAEYAQCVEAIRVHHLPFESYKRPLRLTQVVAQMVNMMTV